MLIIFIPYINIIFFKKNIKIYKKIYKKIYEKYMRNIWEIYEKYMRNIWEIYEKYMIKIEINML
jgi:hypothetical protein